MAKSASFFGLRRGSTKSLTFSVVRGQQVTKDRVSVVSNPKTEAQAAQRMRMTAAKNFYRGLSDILNHSFEGKKVGLENYNTFMSYALKSNAGPYQYKGTNTFEPGAYTIAKGSLPTIETYFGQGTNSRGQLLAEKNVIFCDTILLPAESNFTAQQLVDANEGLAVGDQVTAIVVVKRKGASGSFANIRIIKARGFIEDVTSKTAPIGTSVDFIDKFKAAGLVVENAADKKVSAMNIGVLPATLSANNEEVIAAGIILSRGDAEKSSPWMRSDSTMIVTPEYDELIHGEARYNECVATFMASASKLSSNLYLNGSANVAITRLNVILISDVSGDAEAANGQRAYQGVDAAGNKYAIAYEGGVQVMYEGATFTYKDSGEIDHTLLVSDVPQNAGLEVVTLTEAQVSALLA